MRRSVTQRQAKAALKRFSNNFTRVRHSDLRLCRVCGFNQLLPVFLYHLVSSFHFIRFLAGLWLLLDNHAGTPL
jgi:hypothetical protein